MINTLAYRWHQYRHTRGKRDKDPSFRVLPAICAILEAVPVLARAAVLTIGPRNLHEVGLLDAAFAHVDALDLFPTHPAIRRGDMHRLPYANGQFGLVFTSHCLEHARDLRRATDEIARVLTTGGYVWITVPRATERNDHDRIVFQTVDDVLTAFRRHDPIIVTETHRSPNEIGVLLRLNHIFRNEIVKALVWIGEPIAARNWVLSSMRDALTGSHIHTVNGARLWRQIQAVYIDVGTGADEPRVPVHSYIRWSWLRSRLLRTASYVSRERTEPTYAHKLSLRAAWRRRLEIAWWRWVRALGVDPERVASAVERTLPVSGAARRLLAETDPDVVVIAGTTVYQGLETEIVKAARARGVPVIAQPAAWDTLVSKGAFLVRPDALAVWGEQSARQAVTAHGFPPERVHVVGPIQWDGYRCPRGQNADAARNLPDRLILVAGSTVAYWRDEEETVRRLVEWADSLDVHVWYRPHPVTKARSGLVDGPRLTIDRRGGGWTPDPGLITHYRALLTRSVALVTAFSTMIVEAALFGVPSLVIGFGGSTIGHGGVLEHARYAHMTEVLRWPGVVLCRTESELVSALAVICRHSLSRDVIEQGRHLAQQVALCDGHAAERLAAVIADYGMWGRA